ncbi:MAG: Hsp20/alpha crystallin family protein [Thermoproteota archaeon]
MTNKWWKKKRKKDPWFDIFREFDKIDKMMDEMMRQAFQPFETTKKGDSDETHTYGFSFSMGPEGKLDISKLNKLKKDRLPSLGEGDRDPLVDVLEEGDDVVVVAGLPGVKKEDIDLQASKRTLTIHVHGPDRVYRRKLSLPAEINPEKAETSYKNGVLQVRIEKKKRKGINFW